MIGNTAGGNCSFPFNREGPTMPAFTMPIGETETWESLDSFAQGYFEAMFFTDCTSDAPELEHATFDDIAPDTMAQAIAECARFQTVNAALLEEAYSRDYDATQAGRDFWFTRNGCGVGFWDREPLAAHGLNDRLSDACTKQFSQRDTYRGDDGKVYLA
jgi:hypothetical protein